MRFFKKRHPFVTLYRLKSSVRQRGAYFFLLFPFFLLIHLYLKFYLFIYFLFHPFCDPTFMCVNFFDSAGPVFLYDKSMGVLVSVVMCQFVYMTTNMYALFFPT